MKFPSGDFFILRNTSKSSPPILFCHNVFPCVSNFINHKSEGKSISDKLINSVVLLPEGVELLEPPTRKPSDTSSITEATSAASPPRVLSHSTSPFLSTLTIQ